MKESEKIGSLSMAWSRFWPLFVCLKTKSDVKNKMKNFALGTCNGSTHQVLLWYYACTWAWRKIYLYDLWCEFKKISLITTYKQLDLMSCKTRWVGPTIENRILLFIKSDFMMLDWLLWHLIDQIKYYKVENGNAFG